MSGSPARATPTGFAAVTLGCKLNQFDTAAIEGELVRRGYPRLATPRDAAIVVLNTCTVTARADADARKRIRQLRRDNPDSLLLVTGCYAELDRAALAAMDEVDRVFGNREKSRWPAILDELGLTSGPIAVEADAGAGGDRGCDGSADLPQALHFGERSRAFLKIQEGCRLACSYCVIPRVRGASRSVDPQVVERAAADLFRRGYRELVLTGVNTGDYGRDLEPRTDLATLLRRLLAICGPNRIRLNSLEPLTVTDEIVATIAGDPRIAPHLQIPLQSGTDAVLTRMRRNYRFATYLERLERLRAAVPRIGLGADVIVGFPGEDDAAFRQTHERIAASPLNYLHVFSWSARPGTPAATYDGMLPPSEIRRRSGALRALGAELSDRFRRSLVGRVEDAVVLGPDRSATTVRALSGNFVELRLPAASAARGDVVRAQVLDPGADADTPARVVGVPGWALLPGGGEQGRTGPSIR